MKVTKQQEKIISLLAKKNGMKSEEYFLILLLNQYRTTFKKDYPMS
jgi:hypothetical protein